jgi:serine/threonine-protein kinase
MATTDSEDTVSSRRGQRVSTSRIALERYRFGAVIGSGGMGDVYAAEDQYLGRDVAIKCMQVGDPDEHQLARFTREARIQAKLQHPAIAPVHELGRDARGFPFIVMKKLAGTTLHAILDRDDEQYTRQRLLRAFVEVCLAMEYAHVHKIIHRDLKPSNIMLGDFGEVYVLDWGIAKVLGETDEIFNDLVSGSGPDATGAGDVVGTRAYMSPEQAKAPSDVDARADVFSLGRILAEIIEGDAPPELAALCARAMDVERDRRAQSARELADVVQRYLDGDRDLALRRKLASDHLGAAQVAFAADDRATAMREAGRALALDPALPGAAEIVGRLMLEPPREVPQVVSDAVDRSDMSVGRQSARAGLRVHVVPFVAMLVVFATGARGPAIAFASAIAVTALVAWLNSRGYRIAPIWTALACSVHVAVLSHLCSVVAAAGVAALLALIVCLNPHVRGRAYASLVGLTLLVAALGPFWLERAGVLTPNFTVTLDGFQFHSPSLDGGVVLWYALLALYTLGTIVIGALFGRSIRHTEREMRTKLQLQAWQLAQLAPSS